MGKNPPHVWVADTVAEIMNAKMSGWWCRKEAPVRIPHFDEPEPDVSVARGSRDDYRDRIAEAEDVALVAEVSDTSLARDQGPSGSPTPRGASPCTGSSTWSISQVEVYTDPGPDGYSTCQVFVPGQDIPVVIEGVVVGQIAAADILP